MVAIERHFLSIWCIEIAVAVTCRHPRDKQRGHQPEKPWPPPCGNGTCESAIDEGLALGLQSCFRMGQSSSYPLMLFCAD
jgi:hypothetical protein